MGDVISLTTQEPVLEGVVPAQGELFDYSKLDQETQILLRIRAGEIQGLAKRMASDTVAIGGKLAEVKDRLGGNGRFVEWLHTELRWSERTAYNFIAVYQKFHGEDLALENVAASALYLLAAPSTPAEAVAAAKQIANSGEQVTHGVAKEIVRQAKQRKAAQQPALVDEPEEPESDEPDTLFADEPVPAAAAKGFDAASFPTERFATELERMGNLRWKLQGPDDDLIQICYVQDGGGRQQPFVVTEWDPIELQIDVWPLVPIAEYSGEAFSYADYLDSDRDPNSLVGIKLNCGSRSRPAWWVISGGRLIFTAKLAEEPAPPAEEVAICVCGHRADQHELPSDCTICICDNYQEAVTPGQVMKLSLRPAKGSAPKAQPTTEAVKADAELEALWSKTKVEIGFTLMPSDGNAAGRMIVGSIAAEGFNTLFFNVRGWEAAGLAKLEVELARFKRELLDRRQKPAPKTSTPPAKSLSKPAAKASSKKPAGKPAAKPATKTAKKGGSKK